MNRVPEAICWHEGMQLLPQHFQLQSLRAEGLAAYYAAAAQPYYWGVTRLELDHSMLSAGKVRIMALTAVLPDGLLVQHDAANGTALEFDCTALPPMRQNGVVTLYLALPPLYRASQLQAFKERYVSVDSEPVADLASGEFPTSLPLWRPSPRIVDGEGRADFICMPLLRLRRHESGFSNVPYSPPCPVVTPDSTLGQKLVSLCCLAREKAMFLSQRLQLARKSGDAQDVAALGRQLDGLWNRLPELEAALACGVAHPLTLHHVACGMLGATASLDASDDPPVPPPFDYQDILASFEPLLSALRQRLDGIHAEYRRYPFSPVAKGFVIDPQTLPNLPEWLVIGLHMPDGSHGGEADTWLSHAVIASESFLHTLERQRMRGMTYTRMEASRKAGYDANPGVFLFLLNTHDEWFDATQPLHIEHQGNGDLRPLDVLVYLKDT
ncbi:MAG: type VI secretion system baseplate subunit TssK [Betaproteobacteria bacterium]|nr:type VI secretion system baseplate subunit TssK [Betaproteobacteria bacterium]